MLLFRVLTVGDLLLHMWAGVFCVVRDADRSLEVLRAGSGARVGGHVVVSVHETVSGRKRPEAQVCQRTFTTDLARFFFSPRFSITPSDCTFTKSVSDSPRIDEVSTKYSNALFATGCGVSFAMLLSD